MIFSSFTQFDITLINTIIGYRTFGNFGVEFWFDFKPPILYPPLTRAFISSSFKVTGLDITGKAAAGRGFLAAFLWFLTSFPVPAFP